MDVPYFNVIYSWKLSAQTLTNLIDLFNNIIFQARQTSPYEHWLDQVSAAECQQAQRSWWRREGGIFSPNTLLWWKMCIHKWSVWAVFLGSSMAVNSPLAAASGGALRALGESWDSPAGSALAWFSSAVAVPRTNNELKMLHVCSWLLCSLLTLLPSHGISNLHDSLGSFSACFLAPGPSWHSQGCSGRWLCCPSKLRAPPKRTKSICVNTSSSLGWDTAVGWRPWEPSHITGIKKSLGLFSESHQKPKGLGLQNKYNSVTAIFVVCNRPGEWPGIRTTVLNFYSDCFSIFFPPGLKYENFRLDFFSRFHFQSRLSLESKPLDTVRLN